MKEPALRDDERFEPTQPVVRLESADALPVDRVQRWREKIEVRLDNRQVFFLFFGSAVVACMLFVLGVIVGKRIESRGRAAAPEIADPLAVLDRAGKPASAAASTPAEAPREELTFPSKLIAGPSKGRAPKPVAAAKPADPPRPKPVAVAKPAAAPVDPPKPKLAPPPADPAKAPKGKYTLHLGTFPTKDEADAYAKKYAAQGAFVVASESADKTPVFRVRCGNFASYPEVTAAKTAFEKRNNVIAFVAAR
jgi:cell division septation protein DedD